MRAFLALLVFLTSAIAAPAVAQSPTPAPGELDVPDKEGDVSVRSAPAGMPSAPVHPSVDILGLKIHSEDAEGLWLDLRVKQLSEPAGATMPGSRSYTISFALEKPTVVYRANFYQYNSFGNGTPSFAASFCAGTSGGCTLQRASGGADYARNALTIFVPKLSLMGRNAIQTSYARQEAMPNVVIGPGSKLVDVRAEASGAYFLGDRVPDAGGAGPFVFKFPAANDRIRVSLAKDNQTQEDTDEYENPYAPDRDGAFPVVSVDASGSTAIKLEVSNLNGAKRIANLSAAFADPKAGTRWSVRMAPSLAVPGNESRTVNLVVSTKPEVQHREEAIVKVQAQSIGFRDELGALTLRLVASVPPSVGRDTLYFHGAKETDNFWSPLCDALRVLPWMCYDRFWMNTLETDPFGSLDAGARGSSDFTFNNWVQDFDFPLDAPLSRDLVLTPKVPVVTKLKVASSVDGLAHVSLYAGDRFVGEGNQPFRAQSTEPLEVAFLPLLDATRLPAGSPMSLRVRLSVPSSAPTAAANAPQLTLKESSLKLPVIADPNETAQTAPPLGDAFISLSLKGEREEFVNPSEARAFQMTVLNEGSIEDVVTLGAGVDGEGCRAEFRPGSRYRLDPGDSTRFGVLVHAPPQAKEGMQCKVRVNATSQLDPQTVAYRDVVVTVTRGVDTPNDAENYTLNSDASTKLAKEDGGKGSPGPASLGVLAAIAGGVVLRRRRSKL